MSYTGYFTRLPLSLPQGLGVALAGWTLINVFNGRPKLFHRELSAAEFNATPENYLQHPDHHHVAFPKVPGQASVEDGLGHLQHAAARAKGHH